MQADSSLFKPPRKPTVSSGFLNSSPHPPSLFLPQQPGGTCEQPSQDTPFLCLEPCVAPASPAEKIKVFSVSHKALHILPGPLPALTSSHFPLCSFYASHTGLPPVAPTHKAHFCLRAFGLFVPSCFPLRHPHGSFRS